VFPLNEANLAIRYGLAAIKNCGTGLAEAIVTARGNKPFSDLNDFLHRVDLRQINKRGLEYLIRAGALDCLGDRGALLAGIDTMFAECQRIQREKECGQRSFFDMALDYDAATFCLPTTYQKLPKQVQLNDEHALLGAYLSGHPLDALLRRHDSRLTPASSIDETSIGQRLQLAGIIKESHTHITKNGEKMVFATLEDNSGIIDLTIFPRTLDTVKELLEDPTALLLVSGKADYRGEKPQIIVDAIERYDDSQSKNTVNETTNQVRFIDIEIPLENEESIAMVENVYNLLSSNRGDTPFQLSLCTPAGRVKVEFEHLTTRYSKALEQEVIRLVGREHFKVAWA